MDPGSVFEEDYQRALSMIENNYVLDRKAFALLERAAQGGYVHAQRKLGNLYGGYTMAEERIENYTPRTCEIEKSIRYYDMAARQGDAESAFRLGQIFTDGQKIEEDPLKAVDYYQMALDCPQGEAQYRSLCAAHLADMLLRGCYERVGTEDGMAIKAVVPVDMLRASELLRLSWNLGNPSAGMILGEIYLAVKDNHHAEQVFRALLNMGFEDAQDRIEQMRAEGLLDEQGEVLY